MTSIRYERRSIPLLLPTYRYLGYVSAGLLQFYDHYDHLNSFNNSHCMPIYIQRDATLRSIFYLETALHVSGGTTTHHQERIQLYLQHLVFVTPLLLPAAIVEELEPV